jgi:hypothetical protein
MFDTFTRRQALSLAAGSALSGWLARLAYAAEEPAVKSCILLWMSGGPSHLDTFDLKPDAPNNVRGEFEPIHTAVPGIEISEHFPKFATLMGHAALLRGMSTVESDHQLASYHVHTGYQKRAGGIAFPARLCPASWGSGTSRCRTSSASAREPGMQRVRGFSVPIISRLTSPTPTGAPTISSR